MFVAKNNKGFSKYINICFAKYNILVYIILLNNIDVLELNRKFLLIEKALEALNLYKIFLEKDKNINAKLLNKSKDILISNNTKSDIYLKQDSRTKKLLIYTDTKNIIFKKIINRKVNKFLLILINYSSKNLILYSKIIDKSRNYTFAK